MAIAGARRGDGRNDGRERHGKLPGERLEIARLPGDSTLETRGGDLLRSFGVVLIKDGITRLVNGLPDDLR